MLVKTFWRLLLVLGLAFVSASALSAQGRVTRPGRSNGGSQGSSNTSLITFPSTFRYTQYYPDDPKCPEVTSYFIFRSANEVIWCLESDDDYLYAIAYGTYNKSSNTICFSQNKVYSSLNSFRDGDIIFTLRKIDGSLYINSDNRRVSYFLGKAGNYVPLKKCDNITPSSSLARTSWKGSYPYSEEQIMFYFQSASEVIVDGEPHSYILIEDKVGILSGDNPTDEAFTGVVNGDVLLLHRSGFRKNMNKTWFDLQRSDY
ncbi:MAG: hypothetical protein J1E38_09060 [Paramuribaculum sp.]|nr:hypothetical protein [Paramuribaculum sp.]